MKFSISSIKKLRKSRKNNKNEPFHIRENWTKEEFIRIKILSVYPYGVKFRMVIKNNTNRDGEVAWDGIITAQANQLIRVECGFEKSWLESLFDREFVREVDGMTGKESFHRATQEE